MTLRERVEREIQKASICCVHSYETRVCLADAVDVALRLLSEVGKHAEAMRVCPNGMCGHCVEILCEEILPRCLAQPGGEEGK